MIGSGGGTQRWLVNAGAVAIALAAAMPMAPTAAADPAPDVVQAVSAARGGAPCGPLQYDSTIEQAADIVNRSTYAYLTHTAENVPADDPHPTAIVNDLGIDTTKVISLQGAAHDTTNAIKGLLLQGRNAIPDCSYTEFGVSHLYEPQMNYNLVVVVLVAK